MSASKRVANWPVRERAELFEQTAATSAVTSAAAIEKDYWICWFLGVLFSTTVHESLVFKGGTTLSKVFNVIERFSEDIDLSVERTVLGLTAADEPDDTTSKTQAKKRLQRIPELCGAWVSGPLRAELLALMTRELPDEVLRVEPDADDASTLICSYPPALPAESYGVAEYIRPSIRLEFGARAETWPVVTAAVVSYAKEAFPGAVSDAPVTVRALSAQRTFWEKATIAHSEHHRPDEKPIGMRLARHYYDLTMMMHAGIAAAALSDDVLRAAVVKHKMLFFPLTWARYDEAVRGSFKIVPRRRGWRNCGPIMEGCVRCFSEIPRRSTS